MYERHEQGELMDRRRLSSQPIAPTGDDAKGCSLLPQPGNLNRLRTRSSLLIGPRKRRQKRVLDLVCASVLILLCAPLMAIIAVAIKLDSPGPIFFRQRRRGYAGSTFEMLKFRSMYAGAGDGQHREAVTRWISGTPDPAMKLYKIERDARVTRVGNIIRRTNLDELPQLFNVLKDEMSIVGPRPALEYEYAQYCEGHMRRFAVPPGITGLGRSAVGIDYRLSRWSTWICFTSKAGH